MTGYVTRDGADGKGLSWSWELRAHVSAARALLAQGGAVGRKLDFLMQEFNREANTLCSKSQDHALTAVGLDLKLAIDQTRVQVQNVE